MAATATSSLRFVLLGDDRASSAFARFARQVNATNAAVDRNRVALRQQSGTAASAQGSIGSLTAVITGFDSAMTAGSRKSGLFARALAGVNLATGILEPAMAGLITAAGGLAAAFGTSAVGLGAYGLVLGNVASELKKLDELQKAAAGGNKKAQQALNQFVKGLSPAMKAFYSQLDATKTQYRQWAVALEKPVLTPLTAGLKLVNPALNALTPLVRDASRAVTVLVGDLGKDIRGGGFARWIERIRPAVFTSIVRGGRSVINIIKGIGGVIAAFVPVSGKITGGVEKATAAFARWGQTLSSHSGFQSLVAMARKDGPLLTRLLRNMGTVFRNVGSSMAAMATPANSRALLSLLANVSGVLAQLSRNKALVQFVLYLGLARSATRQLSGAFSGLKDGYAAISGGVGTVKTAAGWLGRFRDGFRDAGAAASAFSGTAGTLGGKFRTVVSAIGNGAGTVLTWIKNVKWAAAAQKIWNGVQVAFNFIMSANPIALVIIAIGALVVAVIYCWKHFKWFRDFVKAVWKGIQAGAVWLWHALVRIWDFILAAAKAVWNGIREGWATLVHVVRVIVAGFVDKVLGFFGMILHGAAVMWGWVPKLGDKLKEADKKFQQFRDNVNRSILGISGRKINVRVGFDVSTGVTPPGAPHPAARGWRVPGYGGGDQWPALLEGGEAVVPKHLTPAVAPFLRAHGVPGFAHGGLAGSGGITVGATFPPVHVIDKAVLAAVRNLAQQHAADLYTADIGSGPSTWRRLWAIVQGSGIPGLTLTSAFRPGGSSYHALGEAIDVASAGAGSTDPGNPMNRLYRWLYDRYHRQTLELIHWPYGGIKNGRDVAGSFWPTSVWLQHMNHVHWAAATYDRGGLLLPGHLAVNTSRKPEMVRSAAQEDHLAGWLAEIAARLDAVVQAVYTVAPDTSAGVAGALGGAAKSAHYSSMYGA